MNYTDQDFTTRLSRQTLADEALMSYAIDVQGQILGCRLPNIKDTEAVMEYMAGQATNRDLAHVLGRERARYVRNYIA